MFVAVTENLVTSHSFNADALLKPTAEALVRLAFAKDPGAKEKVGEIAAFVSDGVDDGTFITLADIEWAVLESIPEGSNPLWSALVFTLGYELRELASKRGLTEARIHVDVKQLLAMIGRIAKE